MSKALRTYPEASRLAVAERRVAANTGGLGYLAALAFLKRKAKSGKASASRTSPKSTP